MALSDFLGSMGVNIGGGGSAVGFFTNFALFILFAGVFGGITWYIVNRMSYRLNIHVFEDISGHTTSAGDDKAKEITLPFTSVRAIYLRKNKLFLPRPSMQTNKGHYWYFKRKDGEWLNTGPKFNPKTGMIELIFDHADMRLQNASLKKLIEKSYKKMNWLKEYAPYIAIVLMILILGIVNFIIVGEVQKVTNGLSSTADKFTVAIDKMDGILGSLDNIQTQSGIRTVT